MTRDASNAGPRLTSQAAAMYGARFTLRYAHENMGIHVWDALRLEACLMAQRAIVFNSSNCVSSSGFRFASPTRRPSAASTARWNLSGPLCASYSVRSSGCFSVFHLSAATHVKGDDGTTKTAHARPRSRSSRGGARPRVRARTSRRACTAGRPCPGNTPPPCAGRRSADAALRDVSALREPE